MNNNIKIIALILIAISIIASWTTLVTNWMYNWIWRYWMNDWVNDLDWWCWIWMHNWEWWYWMWMHMWMHNWDWWWMMWFWFWKEWWFLNNLTTEEKTKLDKMTNEEKKLFLETKRNEFKTKQDLKEKVIDKILNWETLSKEEETIKQEIIKQRTEFKQKRNEMKYENRISC